MTIPLYARSKFLKLYVICENNFNKIFWCFVYALVKEHCHKEVQSCAISASYTETLYSSNRFEGYQGNISEMNAKKTELGKQATARTSCNSNTTANKHEV